MTHDRIEKPVALVTGGAKRIGSELSLHLSRKGYRIALHYSSSRAEAQSTEIRIREEGGACEMFCCDFADAPATQRLMSEVISSYGRLDLLINNASTFKPGTLKNFSIAELDLSYAVHLRAPCILMQDFAKLQSRGQIINILDTTISQNTLTHVPYLLMKKALRDLTLMAALELSPDFRVNGICPGPILAPEGKNESYLKTRGEAVPLKVHGRTEQICSAVDFLLSADYMTGQILFQDGGAHLL